MSVVQTPEEFEATNDFTKFCDYCDYIEYVLKHYRAGVDTETKSYFVTVNPKEKTELSVLQKLLTNFLKRRIIKDYIYSYEQRSETMEDIGKGLHIHMLIKVQSDKSKYLRQYLGESFKRVIGYNNNNIINIRHITKDMIEDKISYIKGYKWDKEKDKKILIDKEFRKNNNLLEFYLKSDINIKDGELSKKVNAKPEETKEYKDYSASCEASVISTS
nr:rep protein [Cressdnaviricota sp.]